MKSSKTPERVQQARNLRSSGLSYQKIGDKLGISKKTAMLWVNEDYNQKHIDSVRDWESRNKEQVCNNSAIYNRDYYKANKESIKLSSKSYYKRNRQQVAARHLEYMRRKRRNDIHFRLADNLRCRLYQALKRNYKAGSAVSDLGCSIEELKQHLESQFQEGMTWDNYGQWHIDHIKPLASFDLINRDQLLEACHYTNLQPLWALDNLLKG